MKRKTIITISIICAVLFLIINYFIIEWYNNTHTGTRSGKVIDAITGKPIQGAVVKCSWEFSVFMGGAIGGNLHISREVLTDEQGQYYIPNIYHKKESVLLDGGFGDDMMLVYKDGYAVYTTYSEYKKPIVGRSYGYSEFQKYSPKGNIVKLHTLKEGTSHEDHIFLIESYTTPFSDTELLKKELEQERGIALKEAIERRNNSK